MTAAGIHLRRVRVSGWKGISEPVEITFGDRSWLIHGENEVGKSSVFSGIRFALFEDPDTKGAYAESWVHNASAEANVEVELQINEATFTVHKTRTQKGSGMTRLFSGVGGGRSERASGKDAVNEILALVGAAQRRGRAEEMPTNWGILAWLLAPQGMDSVSPARDNATQLLGLERAIGNEMLDVEQMLAVALSDQLTSGGKKEKRSPKKGGPLNVAMDLVRNTAEAVASIKAKQVEYMAKLEELSDTRKQSRENEIKLKAAARDIDVQHEAKADLRGLEGEIGTLEEKLKTKAAEVKIAKEAIETLIAVESTLHEHEAQLREIASTLGEKGKVKKEVDRALNQWDQTRERALEARHEKQKAIERKTQLINRAQRNKEIENLKEKHSRIAAIEVDLVRLKAEVSVLDELDEDDLRKYDELIRKLDYAERYLYWTGVTVNLEGALDARWVVDDHEVEWDAGIRFARELVIDAQDFKVTLRRDQETNDQDTNDQVQIHEDGRKRLEQLGVSTTEELRDEIRSQEKRREKLQILSAEKARLGNLEDIEDRLRVLKRDSDLPDGEAKDGEDVPDINLLLTDIQSLETERDKVDVEINKATEEKETKEAQRNALIAELLALRERQVTVNDLKCEADERRGREIEKAGTLKTRKQTLEELQVNFATLNQTLNQKREQKTTEENAQKAEVLKANRMEGQLARDQRSLDAKVLKLKEDCEALGGEGLQRTRVQLDQQLLDAREAEDRIKRRVYAEERLLRRFRQTVQTATEIEVGPIQDQVEAWLARVSKGKWLRAEMDTVLNVTSLGEGSGRTIAGEKQGSGGLKQVIHALIRLAVAVNIHQAESAKHPDFPAVSLVMDESQSHVDAGRVQRLVTIFNEQIAAGRVQVIALSHRRDEFQSLNAMNYDVQTREAYDPDELY